jgi:uncharacterized protein YjdB
MISLLFIALVLNGCAKKTETIQFLNNETSINVGDRLSLQTAVIPADANQDIVLKSSDEGIAIVNGQELLAVADGTVTITALQDNVVYGSFTISINPVLATDIKFSQESLELGIGRSVEILADLIPINTTNRNITYASSDSSIAKVDGNSVTAISAGSAIITAAHASGLTADLAINVIPVLPDVIEISGASSLQINSSDTLSVDFSPVDVTDRNITWSSSDKKILSVKNGVLFANKIGTAVVTATHTSGIIAAKEVEVTPIPAQKVSLSSNSGGIVYAKESLTLTAKIFPDDTTDKTLTWSSDNPSIASVKNGKVTGVSAGTTSIRATTINQIEAVFNVTVKSSTQNMKVTVSAYSSDYNHVGNEWGEYFSVNRSPVRSGSVVSVTRNKKISVYTEIWEDDSIPDVGSASYSFNVKTDYFESGFTITQTINVRENRGRYSGNVATWSVEYTFTPT